MYSRNSIGPRTDPCGTPHKTAEASEVDMPQRTDWMRPLRYDVNHSSTLSPIPYDVFRRRNKVSWSTVSNAADKASKVNTATSPVSNADRISARTLRTAVSVEWCAR